MSDQPKTWNVKKSPSQKYAESELKHELYGIAIFGICATLSGISILPFLRSCAIRCENPAEIASIVPQDFGAKDGTEIAHNDEILSKIDLLLGKNKPPAIEYIFCEPYSDFKLPILGWLLNWGFTRNPYGHAAVRYTLHGKQRLMNIVGWSPGEPMVNFLDPTEYFFSTKAYKFGSPQGGMYNRNMVTVRIEEYDEEKVEYMHRYFRKLSRRESEEDAKFSIIFSPIYNTVQKFLPVSLAERGNCARFTSRGLQEAEVLKGATLFPKNIWVQMFEIEKSKNPDNVNVVYFKRVPHAQHWDNYAGEGKPSSGVTPFSLFDHFFYLDLLPFANVVVEVPPGKIEATITKQPNPAGPSFWRQHKWWGSIYTAAGIFVCIKTLKYWRAGRLNAALLANTARSQNWRRRNFWRRWRRKRW